MVTGSTGRFDKPTIFSAILKANAKIVKDELTPKDVFTILVIYYYTTLIYVDLSANRASTSVVYEFLFQ
jgi:hypothetical protein